MRKEEATARHKVCKLARQAVLASVLIPLGFSPNPAHATLTIVVSGTVDLHFGSMTESGAGGTMAIDTAGTRTAGGGVTAIAGSGLHSQGVLSIAGSTGVAIDVSMTAATFTVDDGGAGAPMNVNGFDINGGGATVTVTLAANPSTFPLGATLNVNAAQVAGSYSGTYTVSANYQ
ncbi:MAG: DUF4402 domain-containing protein [Alphaproteobacteria bacterium]|nr:DUF4402 domain-containing protein [Alphaproteobacteria bacterium]